ncbi:PKD domain-containing protein [Microbacterium sp. NIBRBAC000506063]|uniref:PKD domain-containing protein n=1 Tax=Microbacterium sp. NIBRBAC000506063 TaxID=2734618 RepID=UPI001BB79753|nr:PKD domain-containing protein [Microbacterium sp. NIBRBAC000506063]QTV80408.1 PKD domain-containing protein [Microbacterium sp. NIBRBAC000506063]
MHEEPCTSNLGGAHFRFDESQPFVEENEIWPYFTSDTEGRSGLVEVVQPQRAGHKAVSIVIHDPDNPALRIGCVDLAPSISGLEYTWDFGDGTTGEGPDPDHVYTAPGHYDATVTVAHAGGGPSVTAEVHVMVHGAPSPGSVSGVVSAAGGAPVEGACAYLYADAQAPSASFASCADELGAYEITGVTAGDYVLAVADPSGVFTTSWREEPVTVGAGTSTIVDVELAGEPTGHLIGSIAGPEGPAGSVCVFAYERGCRMRRRSRRVRMRPAGMACMGSTRRAMTWRSSIRPGASDPVVGWPARGAASQAGAAAVVVPAGAGRSRRMRACCRLRPVR